MRIVIDLQGAQASNKNRGIGRYCLSIVKSIIKNKNDHDIHLVLSNLFPDTILPLREDFKELISSKNIHIWDAPKNISFLQQNLSKRKIAEKMREAFLESLNPDILLITSLFEGLVDDVVVSIGEFTKLPTCVILYDLIPFIYPNPYLENRDVKAWYVTQLEYLKKSNLLLSISESSRQEGIKYLNLDEKNITNISTAAELHFKQIIISSEVQNRLREKYKLSQSFLMYTGGIDHRKNIEKLIEAFSILPNNIKNKIQLAIVCSIQDYDKTRLLELSKSFGLDDTNVVFTGYVPEEDL
ncbi:MAG: glycosyltransferase, partial [Campylobacteraceae bacterium]|nr:glycosyltransferase [Campylobacteraceae bacterium]